MTVDIEAFWEFVKAQAVQVSHAWRDAPESDKIRIRELSPGLARNLDALAKEVP